jgi:hypothetical protein
MARHDDLHPEVGGQEPADEGADDANNDVCREAEPVAEHQAARQRSGDQANEDPHQDGVQVEMDGKTWGGNTWYINAQLIPPFYCNYLITFVQNALVTGPRNQGILPRATQSEGEARLPLTERSAGGSVDRVVARVAGPVVKRHQVAARPLRERVPVHQLPELRAVTGHLQVCQLVNQQVVQHPAG